MTREQADKCRKFHITVEKPGDEDFKTGFVVAVFPHAETVIVEWDDDTKTMIRLRDLAVQYPEQMEVVA
jgi:hypothetical protein